MFQAPVLNANTGLWEATSPFDGISMTSEDRNSLVELLRIFQTMTDYRDTVDRLTLDCQQYMDKLHICIEIAMDIRDHSREEFSCKRAQKILDEIGKGT